MLKYCQILDYSMIQFYEGPQTNKISKQQVKNTFEVLHTFSTDLNHCASVRFRLVFYGERNLVRSGVAYLSVPLFCSGVAIAAAAADDDDVCCFVCGRLRSDYVCLPERARGQPQKPLRRKAHIRTFLASAFVPSPRLTFIQHRSVEWKCVGSLLKIVTGGIKDHVSHQRRTLCGGLCYCARGSYFFLLTFALHSSEWVIKSVKYILGMLESNTILQGNIASCFQNPY